MQSGGACNLASVGQERKRDVLTVSLEYSVHVTVVHVDELNVAPLPRDGEEHVMLSVRSR